MKQALVIGTGAGGATVANELQGVFDVTVLEAGREFRPLQLDLKVMERIKRAGVLLDVREIPFFMPNMRTQRTADGMVLLNGVGLGGTTTLATGNGVRADGELLCHDIAMPWVVQRDGFIISPYFDYLSFLFNRRWRFPAENLLSLMIKVADREWGCVSSRGRVVKSLSAEDRQRLSEGIRLCTGILQRYGVRKDALFLGTLNAGHPGGMLPLTRDSAESFHDTRLPANVYVADGSLFPRSLGNPPILTIIAMAKRVSRLSATLWA